MLAPVYTLLMILILPQYRFACLRVG
jgi:hypothetical protein